MAACSRPHVLAVPLPAQGHIKPMMMLCRQIAKRGIKVTVVNAQSIHDKLVSSANLSGEEAEEEKDYIVLMTVPDGLTPDDDPNNPFTLMETLPKTMPEALTNLIERINSYNPDEKISCVIADLTFAWVFDVAEKMGAEPVGFSPPSAGCLAMLLHSLKLLDQGVLDTDGTLKKGDVITLSDDIPPWRRENLPWCFPGDPQMEKFFFQLLQTQRGANKARWSLCNSCYELEPAAAHLVPNLLPIGPLNLLTSNTHRSSPKQTNFYPEDTSCLSWMDNKPNGSVIYVSFGSLAVFSRQQLDELALGLELSGRPFLWVTRPDLANGSRVVYPDGFLERVSGFGKIVEWAPQNEVLSHPAIGCFISHCGWNSTLEGVSKGVPFLCWPYFADQLHNASYICDKWEIGLKIIVDEQGIRSRHEIDKEIGILFSANKFKVNALKLKEMGSRSVSKGGSSYKNLEQFIDHISFEQVVVAPRLE